MRYVRVRIPGVGEWSQLAEKPLRPEVGEVLVEASEHAEPYRDYPEPPDENRPLDVAAAAEPPEENEFRGSLSDLAQALLGAQSIRSIVPAAALTVAAVTSGGAATVTWGYLRIL